MSEQKRNNEVDEAASALIENSESVFENTEVKAANRLPPQNQMTMTEDFSKNIK